MIAAAAEPANPSCHTNPSASLLSFLNSLLTVQPEHAAAPAGRAGLWVACAALRDISRVGPPRPAQVCVIGPTQVGKSTLVNSLLGTPAAEVSPLAGFTVHALAFTVPGDTAWANDLIPGFRRVSAAELRRGELDAYAVTQVPVSAARDWAVWDTPDFDSLHAGSYQRGLLEVVAIADLVVMVVSKEKYSDLSVANMLRLLAPLEQPLLIVLNKLAPESADLVQQSLQRRLVEIDGRFAAAPIVPVEIQPSKCGPRLDDHACERTRAAATQLLNGESPSRRVGVARLVRSQWSTWTAPLRAEHAALSDWRSLANSALAALLADYRRDYLDHPQRYDTFRRATIELLNLLELPGLGGALGKVRSVVTWPARQLFAARQAWSMQRRERQGLPRVLANEEQTLFDAVDRMLISLRRDAARRESPSAPAGRVWRAISQRLELEESALRARFHAAARDFRARFEPEVVAAAGRLYQTLQHQPRMLHSLRAARATADAASILFAVKTGGFGVNELLLAPALFAVTSMLTEGALGTYMERVARDLKTKQLERLERDLIHGAFLPDLSALGERIEGEGVTRIRPEQLAAAEAALAALEQDRDG